MVASDRVSAFDVIMAEPIPDKGRVLTAMTASGSRRWPTSSRARCWPPTRRRSPPRSAAPGAPARVGRPGRCWSAGPRCSPLECIVRGLPGRPGLGGVRALGHGPRHGDARAGCCSPSALPEPIFTPSTKAAEGHDLNIGMAEAVDLVGAESAAGRGRAVCLELYRRAAARAAAAGLHPGRHQVRAGLRRRRALPVRRGVHARTPRGCGRPTRCVPGHDAAGLRQAAAARLAGGAALGPHAAPAAAAARGRRRPLSQRYVAAYERVTGRSLGDWYGADQHEVPGAASRCSCGPASPTPRGRPSSGRCPRSASTAWPTCGPAGPSASRSTPPTRARRATTATQLADRLLANPVIEAEPARARGDAEWPRGSASSSSRAATASTTSSRASRRVGAEGVLLWHGDAHARLGSTRSSCPAASPTATTCARAPWPASRPSWTRSRDFARAGGPVVGICNGFQVLTEAGLLPGALQKNGRLRFLCQPARLVGRLDGVGAHRAATVGDELVIPINHFSGNYTCDAETLAPAAGGGPDRAALRRRQPERVGRRHRRHRQRGGQRGRPHAPPRARQLARCSAPRTAWCCCARSSRPPPSALAA